MFVEGMASRHMGKKFSALADDCEPLWLLHMEAEYIGFLVSVETETRLLEHIRTCSECRDKLAFIFNRERDPADELEELFAIDLPEKLLTSSTILDCPIRGHFKDADDYIEARIKWRLDKLREIISNAEIELKQLSEKIREKKP
jgi:hypothetical protein